LGWEPSIDYRQSIGQTIRWFLDQEALPSAGA
jgi:nucleoside-diphosphate-sugar epimerase